jgi:hypothetical protein
MQKKKCNSEFFPEGIGLARDTTTFGLLERPRSSRGMSTTETSGDIHPGFFRWDGLEIP